MSDARAQLLQEGDAKSARSGNSTDAQYGGRAPLARQFGHIFLLLLKFKAWRGIFLLLAVLAMLTHLLHSLRTKHEKTTAQSEGAFEFYDTKDFLAAKHKILVDASTFPAEAKALADIMSKRGAGNANWLKYCTTESTCRAEFISERDFQVTGYIRYSNSPSKRSILECFMTQRSSMKCVYLYQLMVQSLHGKTWSNINGAFRSLKFFSMKAVESEVASEADKNATANVSAPNAVCADWIDRGTLSSSFSAPLLFTAIGASLYFIISTVAFIRAIKGEGFLQLLIRSGLSVATYWAVIWCVTIVECALLSGVFTLSHVFHCPGLFPASNMVHIFVMFAFYLGTLAGLTFLLELLVPPLMVISMMMMGLSLIVSMAPLIGLLAGKKLAFIRSMFPPLYVTDYTVAYMTSSIGLQSGSNPITESHQHYQNILIANGACVVIIALIAVYLDFLLRSGNGLCLPLYYPVSCDFWCPATKSDPEEAAKSDTSEAEPHIESAADLTPSIIVDHVSKAYDNCCSVGPRVLHQLSCKIYKNQITALIGHNGAGKSTLIKILTGDECPDSGEARINGFTVTHRLQRLALRGRISVCPQFDCLCEYLTVMGCIRITLSCKGISGEAPVQRARAMLQRLGLGDKEDVLSTDLSGGQKRKVNTILALLGDPDVVFLDEPTSGLDPVSRRQLWQLLQEEKLGRSIVLCTQFMDEADILADRKIFLCGGKIVCAGSSMFLKRAFGCGLTIDVSLRSESLAPKLLARLRQVRLRSQFKTELQLEVEASKTGALIEAVQTLEGSEEVEAFGLSQANLDDIFMRLSGVSSTEVIEAFQSGELSKFIEKTEKDLMAKDRVELKQSLDPSEKVAPSGLRQLGALLRTNLKSQTRTRSSLCSRFVLPALLLGSILLVNLLPRGSKPSFPRYNAMADKAEGLTEQQILEETDSHQKASSFRDLNFASSASLMTVCIYDKDNSAPSSLEETVRRRCEVLAELTNTDNESIYLLPKPQTQILKDFLGRQDQREVLQTNCIFSPCRIFILYYFSSWNPGVERDAAIGVYTSGMSSSDPTAHVYRRAFTAASQAFGMGGFQNTTALSHLPTPSKFAEVGIEMIAFVTAFCLFPASYLNDPIDDISSRVRGHLASMGMGQLAYWMNLYFQHWIQYSTCYAISIGLLLISENYRHAYFILTACLPVLFLGTTSNQLSVYTVAAVTRKPSTIVTLACNFLLFFLPVYFYDYNIDESGIRLPALVLLPPVAPVVMIIYSVAQASYIQFYYHAPSISDVPGLLTRCWNHKYIQLAMIAMPVHILLLSGAVALAENTGAIRAALFHRAAPARSVDEPDGSPMDQGAEKEAERLLQSPRSPANVLEVRQLAKTYANGVRAVRGVTFGVLAGEIFGLLGANGAGKSTSMSVIVGEESPTGGVAEVRKPDGNWASGREGATTGCIGYCPQHNPLYDNVTVAEHLQLYAAIRGVPASAVERQVSALIQGLGLQPHRDKYARQLSGGNKRRLCLAIALLGDPTLVVVDEASTGVDPENKRFIWGAIRGMLHERRSVMVTTHSMEEVEALCSRVGIMNKGRLIAFGTVQQLRSLHGEAYTLDVLLQTNAATVPQLQQKKAKLRSDIAAQFKGAVVLEDLASCLQFYVPKRAVSSLSGALKWLSANQARLGINYYSLYQMSLDQVFVKLVKQYDQTSSGVQ